MEAINTVVTEIKEFTTWADSVKDPRVQSWAFVSSPLPTLAVVALYLLVSWLGPIFMANRKPLNLRYLMIVYNAALVILSAYMCAEFFIVSFLNPKFNVYCQKVDYSDDPMSLRLAAACWLFFVSKLIELLDTVIFILRKKNNQISFLHIYHHTSMPLLWWVGVHWIPGGASSFGGMVNSFIHTVMYSYYALSGLGPFMQPYLWWKKYLTMIQLVQFITAMGQCVLVLYLDCGFPAGFVMALMGYAFSHLLLFGHFYHKTYVVNGVQKTPRKQVGKEEDIDTPRSTANGRYNLRDRPQRRTPKI